MVADTFLVMLKKLDQFYDFSIVETSPDHFFTSLYNYIHLFYAENTLGNLLFQRLADSKTHDTKKESELWIKAEHEIENRFEETRQYIKKNNISDGALKEYIGTFFAYKEGRVPDSTFDTKIHGMTSELELILMRLNKINPTQNKPFTNKYGAYYSTDKATLWRWKHPCEYLFFMDEYNRIERTKLSKAWYFWEKLKDFYNTFEDYERTKYEQLDRLQFIQHAKLNLKLNELNIILSGIIVESPTFWNEKDFKYYLKMFHLFVKDNLNDLEDISNNAFSKADSIGYADTLKSPPWEVVTDDRTGLSRGLLKLPSGEDMVIRGGFFGGINILIKNFEQYVKRKELQEAIAKHLQGQKKKPGQIDVSVWKTDLKRNKKKFFELFTITHKNINGTYVYKLSHKDNSS